MKSSGVFVRTASGLVRQVSTWDAFVLNISTMTFFWAATWFGWAQFLAPGSNVIWDLVVGTILAAFPTLTVGLFANIYPRSGGDWVYNSRVLHPAVGYTTNFGLWLWNVFWTGMSSYWVSIYGFSTLFLTLGVIMHNEALVNVGNLLYTPPWSAVVATLVIAFISILGLFSTKTFFRAMSATFVIGIVAIVLLIAVLIPYDNSSFIAAFNGFMSQYAPSIPNYYNYVIETARTLGWNYPSPDPNLFSFSNQIGIMATVPIVGYGVWSCFMAGEIKNAQRVKTSLYSMVGSQVAMGVGMITIGLLAFRTFGYEFLGASEYLFYMAPDKLSIPVAPETQFFAMLLYPNPVIAFIVLLGLSLLCSTYAYSGVMMSSRVMLAWSMDRVIPEEFSRVSQKYRSPYVAMIFQWVGATICMLLLAYIPQIFGSFGYATAFAYGGTICWIVTMLSAMLVPYLKKTKDHYSTSPIARLRIAGIPLIVVSGFIGFLYLIWVSWGMLAIPAFGMNPANAGPLPTIAGLTVFAAALIIFGISRYYQKAKGVRVDLVFKEIPPE